MKTWNIKEMIEEFNNQVCMYFTYDENEDYILIKKYKNKNLNFKDITNIYMEHGCTCFLCVDDLIKIGDKHKIEINYIKECILKHDNHLMDETINYLNERR